MAPMSDPDRFEHLRHAALDMLDAGNTMAAVSQLLAVPLAVVARWREEPVPPRPARAPAPPPAPRTARMPGKALRFRTTLVVRRGFPHGWMRHVIVGYVLAALAVGLVSWTLHHPSSIGTMLEVDVASLIGCAWWWIQRHQPLFTLAGDAIVVPQMLGRTTMPYADLADWWLVLHVLNDGEDTEVVGRLLTLHSRGARKRPIEVFVHDHVEIDPAVTERLDQVKKANAGPTPLTPMGQ